MLSEDIINAIHKYHRKGYEYRMIHYLLEKEHGFQISFQYLQKKIIPGLGLRRRGAVNLSFDRLLEVSINEINNGLGGAEQLRRTLAVKHDMHIPRNISRQLCRSLDESGVLRRQQHRLHRRQYISKGPNYAWHLDGYDKLAQFGIYIHGCIDGYSRKVIWLKAGITNRRPQVIANYLLEPIELEGGIPWLLRGDRGSENSAAASITREMHSRQSAFRYGKSTSNQRIERWWGYLRQARSDFWMHRLKLLSDKGLFERDNELQKLCLQYCLLPFVTHQLEECRVMWNCHRIRAQKQGDTVSGIPEILHQHAEVNGVNTYTTSVSDQTLSRLHDEYENSYLEIDPDFKLVAEEICAKLQLPQPEQLDSFDMCEELYVVLSNVIFNL